jgi:hypothetical protein
VSPELKDALDALAGMMRLVGHRGGKRDALLPIDQQPDPETQRAMRLLDRHNMLDFGGVDQ